LPEGIVLPVNALTHIEQSLLAHDPDPALLKSSSDHDAPVREAMASNEKSVVKNEPTKVQAEENHA